MTQQEKDSELTEVLNYKFELISKINWNAIELMKIETAINSNGYVENLAELERLKLTGEKLIAAQRKERIKLSNEKIAKQLKIPYHVVRYQWDGMVRLAA